MPLDDRIRQLSETIIQEVRSPIESALHHLLSDVMTLAAGDRDQAVQAAVATAAADHQAALSALREQAEHDRTDAETLRSQFEAERDTGLAALRETLERENDEKLAAIRGDLAHQHETTVAGVRGDLAREHETIVADLRDQLTREHETAVAGVRDDLAREHETKVTDLRHQLTGEHEATVARLRDDVAREHEAGMAGLREQLAQERDAALASLRERLEQERESTLTDLRTALDEKHDAAIARLRDELAHEHAAGIQVVRDEADREHRAQVQELEVRAAAERETAVQAVRDELGRAHESALHAARTAVEVVGGTALTVALADAEHGKREAETRVAVLEQELEQARTAASHAEQASRDAAQSRLVAEQAAQEAEKKRLAAEQDLGLTHAADREHELACSDRTLAAFRRLDEAHSLTEVLRILADQAASEIGRVAVLLVIDSRLRGWELRGFPGTNPATVDVPVEPGTVFGMAIASRLPASTSDAPIGQAGETLAALLTTPPDRAGLAVPVSIGGRVVAILYADDAGDRSPVVPSNWPEIAEILARHAGHCLEVLTISHASILAGRVQHEQAPPAIRHPDASPFADQRREEESARRYARLLISEIKLYNEAAVEQGRHERDLIDRLGQEIERARRLYEEKIPASVRQRVDCFDQEVVRTLAGGDAGLLGQT